MEHDAERLLSFRVLEYDWYEGGPQCGLIFAEPQTHLMRTGIQSRTMFLWNGLVELLADEVARARSNADCEAAVGRRIIMFEVGDEGWGVAEAVDMRLHMPNAAVSLVVESRRQSRVGR